MAESDRYRDAERTALAACLKAVRDYAAREQRRPEERIAELVSKLAYVRGQIRYYSEQGAGVPPDVAKGIVDYLRAALCKP